MTLTGIAHECVFFTGPDPYNAEEVEDDDGLVFTGHDPLLELDDEGRPATEDRMDAGRPPLYTCEHGHALCSTCHPDGKTNYPDAGSERAEMIAGLRALAHFYEHTDFPLPKAGFGGHRIDGVVLDANSGEQLTELAARLGGEQDRYESDRGVWVWRDFGGRVQICLFVMRSELERAELGQGR